jgi:hypothetical protein
MGPPDHSYGNGLAGSAGESDREPDEKNDSQDSDSLRRTTIVAAAQENNAEANTVW